MKIFAVNGSPRGSHGNTERILQPFLEGARAAGAATEIAYLKDQRINHCTGCFNCWFRTPGVCVHHDDMPELLERIQTADVLIYATPLYYYSVTGLMKDFMDRQLPLVQPTIEIKNEQYSHPRRRPRTTPTKAVLISNSGFPGQYNFAGLLATFKVATHGRLAGAILCTQGPLLENPDLPQVSEPYLAKVTQAGRELVERGMIAPETEAALNKDLIDPQIYLDNANQHFKKITAQ